MDKNVELALSKICKQKEDLTCWVEKEIGCGMCDADIEKLGKVVDMIKDLAEAEHHCVEAEEKKVKAKYYCHLIQVMDEHLDEDEEDEILEMAERYGYNNRRYNNGEYAPAGKGHMTGTHRSGYSVKGGRSVRGGNMGNASTMQNRGGRRMGYPDPMIPPNYNDPFDPSYGMDVGGPWYYHDGEERREPMSQEEKMRHTMKNMKEMWSSANPDLKREMKNDMTSLMNDIPV